MRVERRLCFALSFGQLLVGLALRGYFFFANHVASVLVPSVALAFDAALASLVAWLSVALLGF